MPARAQGENRHAESVERIHAGLAKPHQLVEGESDLAREIAEVTLHHLARERVVASGHRCMRRENICRGDELERGIEIEALPSDMKSNAFEGKECGMAFVHVKDLGINAKRGQDLHSADAEHDLLPHSHFEIAAV